MIFGVSVKSAMFCRLYRHEPTAKPDKFHTEARQNLLIMGPPPPESWRALFVVGILFPLHIILGLSTIPYLCFKLYSGSVPVICFLCVYLPFYLYPAEHRHPGWKGFEALWRVMDYSSTCASYFGRFEVHASHKIDGDAQYFVAAHPHGTVIFQRTFWRSAQLAAYLKRDWRMLGASILFRIPIVREMTLWFGAVDASRAQCERLLKSGVNVCVWPGGLDEANSVDGPDCVRVRTRTGFIRLAVKHGVAVLPVFVFGELDAVSAIQPLPKAVADFCKSRLRFSTTLFVGRWWTFVPRRVPFHMCLGKPCAVKQLATDDAGFDAEVQRVHAEYQAELIATYERHKDAFGYGSRALVFVQEEGEKQRTKKKE